MIATYVPPVRTPLDRDAAIRAISSAFEASVSIETKALACAQSALESGRWQQLWNYNFGNAKAGPTYEGQYTSRRCNEVIGGKLRWFRPEGETVAHWGERLYDDHLAPWKVPPGHPQTRFRAYAGPTDGAYAYIDLLRERFSKAWYALMMGNADAFVHALKAHGYFTAPEAPYHKAVASLQREFVRVLDGHLDVPEEPVDRELAGLLALSDAFLVEDSRDIDFTPSDAVADTPRES